MRAKVTAYCHMMYSAANNETANAATLKDNNMKPGNEPNDDGGEIKSSDIKDDNVDTDDISSVASSDTDIKLPAEQRFSNSNDEETDERRKLRLRIKLLEEQKREDDRLRERIREMENELAMSVARTHLLQQEIELRVLAGNMLLDQNNDQNDDMATTAAPVSRSSSVESIENLTEKGSNSSERNM